MANSFEYDPGDMDVRVEMGTWEQAAREQLIGTFGLGPCIGLALYNPLDKQGFMAHTLASEIFTLVDMLDNVSSQQIEPSQLKAWFSGGEIFEFEGRTNYEEVREDAVRLLTNFGVVDRNIVISWVDNNCDADMVLDCSSGECSIKHRRYSQ